MAPGGVATSAQAAREGIPAGSTLHVPSGRRH